MNNIKFSRKIRLTDEVIPYDAKKFTQKIDVNEMELSPERQYVMFNNCHWGALKLLYSEIEFLVLCQKYIDVSECLVVYIGAQPGFRLKHLYIKHFFPKLHMLLYDPLKFDI